MSCEYFIVNMDIVFESFLFKSFACLLIDRLKMLENIWKFWVFVDTSFECLRVFGVCL
jgi:hypothetical protein